MCEDQFCIWTSLHSEKVFIYDFSKKADYKRSFRTLKRKMGVNEFGGAPAKNNQISAGKVAPARNTQHMNDNALMNVMRIMDDHEKRLNYADEEDKKDQVLEVKPTAQVWFAKEPVDVYKTIDIGAWVSGQEESARSVMLTVFKNDFLKL